MKKDLPTPATLTAERIERFDDDADVHAIAEAATAAILDGGGFGWVKPPKIGRAGTIFPRRAAGAGTRADRRPHGWRDLRRRQLLLPSRNNEAQSFAASIMHHFVAPYARGHGLARLILQRSRSAPAPSATTC